MNPAALDFRELVPYGHRHWQTEPDRQTYQVDFNDYAERKYKEQHGVRVYENGVVEIRHFPSNAPDTRETIRRQFGIHLELLSDIRGIQFVTVEGEPVAKAHIRGATEFLLDHKNGMALHLSWEDENHIRYYGPNARPIGGKPFTIGIPDRSAAKQLREQLADNLNLGLTLHKMQPDEPFSVSMAIQYASDVNSGKCTSSLLNPRTDGDTLRALGWHASVPGRLNELLRDASTRYTEVEYLYFKKEQ
jgi:hypothetical protein